MTISAVGTLGSATSKTFTLTTGASDGKDHFILLWVTSETTADYATTVGSSNLSWDASPLVGHTAFTHNAVVQTVFKGKVIMPSPVTSGTGLLMVTGWIQMWGEDKAWAYMDKLNGNISRYTTSGSRPCELAGAGETAVGLSLPARGARIKAGGAPIDVIVASDGTGWDIQAAGIVRGSKNQADAKTLVDWAVSMPAMEFFGASAEVTALRVRVRKPEFLPPNITEKLIRIDFKWLVKEQGRIIAEWERRYGARIEKKS